MKFTSPRNITLAAGGHVVPFKKGETHNLPPAMYQKALAEGLEPEDKDVVLEPVEDDAERVAKIKAAMLDIATKNDAADFDAGGAPKVKAIEAVAGVKPTNSDERLKLWAEVKNSIGT